MAKSNLMMSCSSSKKRSKSAYRTMSPKTQRNAFDELMTPRSKKRPTTESASKESKTQEPKPPISNQVNAAVESTKEAVEDSGNGSEKTSPVLKKRKPTFTIDKCVSEWEKKADESVSELKKKAAVFDPKRAAFWENGQEVPFLFVTRGLDAIAEESGRTAITEIICNMLRTVMESKPEDLVKVVYFLSNKTAGLQLGVGDAIIIKALAESYSINEAKIKEEYNVGRGQGRDLGLVAIEFAVPFRETQRFIFKLEALSVAKVFKTFHTIAKESGDDRKKKFITKLLVPATDCELKYLIRLLLNKLQIGLGPQTLLAALGHAALYTEEKSQHPANMSSRLEEAAKILKQVYSVLPVYDKIVSALLSGSVWDLQKKCSFTPGAPIKPMTAKPIKEVSEILDKFQNMRFTCEYKYDGERAQIHYMEDGSVEIYSRNNLKKTERFPDVVATVSRLKHPSVTSFVLDCEIVAYDREKKKILPFQILSTRARKNVDTSEIKVEVCIYAFDILYVNGEALLKEQLETRRQHLYKSFEEAPGYFQFAVAITSNDVEEIQKFLDASVDSSCEGLIIKTLDREATYEPSKRSNNWLKLKKDYIDSIGDSLDLVPIGGFHGRGKRTGVYGAFLLACYDHNNEEYQSICKVGSGFSEANLEEYSARLRSKVIPKPKGFYRYSDTLLPDVWFEPIEVWEVKAADLTLSNKNCAAIGIVDPDKGISLRFPRIIRVREDKSPEDATTSEMVADMFSTQKQHQKNEVAEDEDDD